MQCLSTLYSSVLTPYVVVYVHVFRHSGLAGYELRARQGHRILRPMLEWLLAFNHVSIAHTILCVLAGVSMALNNNATPTHHPTHKHSRVSALLLHDMCSASRATPRGAIVAAS